MNQKQVTESVMAEFTPVFKAMIKTNPAIAKIYDCLHNGVHPAQVIESLSYQIIRLQAHMETLQNIVRVELTPAPPVLSTEKPDATQAAKPCDTNSITQDWAAVCPDLIKSMQNIRIHDYPEAAIQEVKQYGLTIEEAARTIYKNILPGKLPAVPVPERDTLHVCYYCGQRQPVTVFDNFDICGPCSEFLTIK